MYGLQQTVNRKALDSGLFWFVFVTPNIFHKGTNYHKTHCEVMDGSHSRSVTKILTAYSSKKTYFRPGARKTEIHSFPTMYIMGGGSFGGNGSK